MKSLLAVLLITAFAADERTPSPAGPPRVLRQFGFVVGRWSAGGETFPESYGAAAGRFSGEVDSHWGSQNLWIETDFAAVLGSGQRYTVHIVVAGKPGGAELTALAINSLSAAGVAYDGRVERSGAVVFTGRAGAKWQRVTYRSVAKREVEFSVEESASPKGPWTRHSRARWSPRS